MARGLTSLRNKFPAKRITVLAMLISLALVLSALERMLPIDLIVPLPGIKLGLPNLVTLFAVYYLDFASGFLIVLIRCLLASLLFGGVTTFFFSVTGGLFALLVMWLLQRCPERYLSPFGVSIGGAAFHNVGQIIAASIALSSAGVFSYLPVLLFSSLATGFLTGLVFYVTHLKLVRLPGMQSYFYKKIDKK
jgi:heptaprenyl diphosphate synthase